MAEESVVTLEIFGNTVEKIYDSSYAHDDAYAVAEAMLSFDELFQKFRLHHIFLIQRSIGMGAASLKALSDTGIPVIQVNQLPPPETQQYVTAYAGVNDVLNGRTSGELMIKARDALDSVRVGVIAQWVWRATKETRGEVGTARCSLAER